VRIGSNEFPAFRKSLVLITKRISVVSHNTSIVIKNRSLRWQLLPCKCCRIHYSSFVPKYRRYTGCGRNSEAF